MKNEGEASMREESERIALHFVTGLRRPTVRFDV
jgi:hypothetical protein